MMMMMNKVPLLITYHLLLVTTLSQASPVDTTNNTTSQSLEEQLTLQQTAVLSEVLKNVLHALQLIDLSVNDVNVTSFEYCYVSGYANPPATNLTIEDRLSYDYRLLEELMLPLEGVLNYESTQLGNDSITYQRLAVALRQLNTSLIEIENIVS
ncbi:uncharacterized protein [Dysidea avara]|uniref:uncharacterized protein n=1 Tax=Dysidea avara TaxID=196820 RepID=UPI003317B4E7